MKYVQSEEGASIRVYSVSEAKPVPIPLISLLNDSRKALNVYSICMKRGYYYITSDEQWAMGARNEVVGAALCSAAVACWNLSQTERFYSTTKLRRAPLSTEWSFPTRRTLPYYSPMARYSTPSFAFLQRPISRCCCGILFPRFPRPFTRSLLSSVCCCRRESIPSSPLLSTRPFPSESRCSGRMIGLQSLMQP